MRGLLMAFIAVDFPGLGFVAGGRHARAEFRVTKTSAKKTTATTV